MSKEARTASSSRRGSIVEPLFDEMITRVFSGSQPVSISRTRTGESESRVLKDTRFLSTLLYFVMVMGAWVEPPWPMRITVSMPSATAASANVRTSSSEHWGWLARSAQPIYCSAQAWASVEKSYSVASLA